MAINDRIAYYLHGLLFSKSSSRLVPRRGDKVLFRASVYHKGDEFIIDRVVELGEDCYDCHLAEISKGPTP